MREAILPEGHLLKWATFVADNECIELSDCMNSMRRLPRYSWLILWLVIVTGLIGCSRRFYRNLTDRDVERLIDEKNRIPEAAVENWHVYPDERARFADFENPDRPRRPPDDPATQALTPDSQPFRRRKDDYNDGTGYLALIAGWDAMNRQGELPPPKKEPTTEFERVLTSTARPYRITLEQSVELSLFNSREYQNRREDLFLSALPVSLQRFAFIPQFFASSEAARQWAGSVQTTLPVGNSWQVNSAARGEWTFLTGATVLARLANRLVIDLSSGRPSVGVSNLAVEVTQPLLQGGGLGVTLEPLTQAERTLVYGIRSYARYRKVHYVAIAGGEDYGNGPYGYSGLGNRFGIQTTPLAPSQGYLPTLLSAAQERNERENIKTLYEYLELFREYQGRGDVSELQVGQVEQQLLRGQATLLQRQQDLQNGVDNLKLQLGVPTSLPLELDDSPILPVRRAMEGLDQTRNEFSKAKRDIEQVYEFGRNQILLFGGGLMINAPLVIPAREKITNTLYNSELVKKTREFQKTIQQRWERWQKLSDEDLKFEVSNLRTALRELQIKQAKVEVEGGTLSKEEQQKLDLLPREYNLGLLELNLRRYEAAATAKNLTEREVASRFDDVVNTLASVLSEARKERVKIARESWPPLPEVIVEGRDMIKEDLDTAIAVASQVALSDRLDLKNARAELVDAWRQIAVQANALLGILDVKYAYNASSPTALNEPLNIVGSSGRHQLIINGELPLVRRAERNNYRAALIAYQRERRNLQAIEDFILNDVRTDLRQLRSFAEIYRIQKRAIEVAYDQVENALDVLQAPPVPDGAGGGVGRAAAQSQQQAANAASLTQQLLNAQQSLVQAQNALYNAYINYLIARMRFQRDIERLPLDQRGVWIDESTSSSKPTLPLFGEPASLPFGDGSRTPRFAELR